jgi:DNA-binding NarL/FixJ family response regulator
MVTKIYLSDNQDITRAGLMYICQTMQNTEIKRADDKSELIEYLKNAADAVVVLDYTLFDINDVEELIILQQRFRLTRWVLFSEELSTDFVRRLIAESPKFSILLKESSLQEIREAIEYAIKSKRFICQRMTEMLLTPTVFVAEDDVQLTPTETEILKDIALGMTTKEIAEKRISSFHTVNTHRKNIFRKLKVNNAHEATKYALRAGLIDSAEYYI